MENNDSPVRILHVVQRMEAAGVQSFIMNIYRNIDRSKIQFDFLTHYNERQFYDDEIEKLGGRIYRLSVREDKNFIKYFIQLHRFFRTHKEYKFVHGHMDSLGFFYLESARINKVPYRIAHAHNVIIGETITKKIRRIMDRLFKVNANILLACSDDAGSYMFGKSAFKIIRNPIDVRKFEYNETVRAEVRKELNLSEHDIIIGNVGRFSNQKNHKFLIEIFRFVRCIESNAKLLLVGKGECEQEIRSLIKNYNLSENVIMLDVRMDIDRIYQAMDAFVFPSLYEGLGIVAIEAQAAGLPTICSDMVPELANVTPLFKKISLQKNADTWAKIILREIKKQDRKCQTDYLVAAGYDIATVKKQIEELYSQSN